MSVRSRHVGEAAATPVAEWIDRHILPSLARLAIAAPNSVQPFDTLPANYVSLFLEELRVNNDRTHIVVDWPELEPHLITLETFELPAPAPDIPLFRALEDVIVSLAENTVLMNRCSDGGFVNRAKDVASGLKPGVVVVMKLWKSAIDGEVIGVAACEKVASSGSGPGCARPTRSMLSFEMKLLLIKEEHQGKRLGGILLDQLLLSLPYDPHPCRVNVTLQECLNEAQYLYVGRKFARPLEACYKEEVFLTRIVDDRIVEEVNRKREDLRMRVYTHYLPGASGEGSITAEAMAVDDVDGTLSHV